MSYVYFITDGEFIKIGKANDKLSRLATLSVGNVKSLALEAYIETSTETQALNLEYALHKKFENCRVKGEWFNLPETYIQELTKTHNLVVYKTSEISKTVVVDFCVFGKIQSILCKSSKDIQVFWEIVDKLDKQNEFRTSAQVVADRVGVARSKVTSLLSNSVKHNFLQKVDRGVYQANPFMIKAKGASNETIEQLQREWYV